MMSPSFRLSLVSLSFYSLFIHAAVATTTSSTSPFTPSTTDLQIISTSTNTLPCSHRSQKGDTLHVFYRGKLNATGDEFDSNYGHEPFIFTLDAGQVIRGWDIGLMNMCIGEERQLMIPPWLGYGRQGNGPIPGNAWLIFDTQLQSIEGVTESANVVVLNGTTVKGSQDGPIDGMEEKDESSGECKLLGGFAILVQIALGGLAILALVAKRWREHPRRPLKVWSFDVSKQVVGSVLVHFANLFLSMLFAEDDMDFATGTAKVVASAAVAASSDRTSPNPCSFYLLNLAIDTTVGIPILVQLLKLLHYLFLLTPLADPPESLKSGNYGHPPRFTWWMKQSIIYFLGLLAMKVVVYIIFAVFPWLGWVGDWALRWTEGKEWVQITIVMFIFPLIMNALQYWIIDSFIKDPAGEYVYGSVGNGEGTEATEEEERFIDSDDDEENQIPTGFDPHGVPIAGDLTKVKSKDSSNGQANKSKEANSLTLPIESRVEGDNVDENSKTK